MKVPVERLGDRQIAFPISATATFAEFMMAVASGATEVYMQSGRVADSILMARDRYFYIAALSDQDELSISSYEPIQGVGPLTVHVIDELHQGQIVVAEEQGLSVGDDWAYALITT